VIELLDPSTLRCVLFNALCASRTQPEAAWRAPSGGASESTAKSSASPPLQLHNAAKSSPPGFSPASEKKLLSLTMAETTLSSESRLGVLT